MTNLVDFVAISLLPSWTWLHASELLRTGVPPGPTLDLLLTRHWSDQAAYKPSLYSRAHAAIERASAQQLTPVMWTDSTYPVALTTIVDPPVVLWTRGAVDAFAAPAVAIVGARAASAYGLAVAERLAADLSERGLAIVSGLA